MGQRAQEKPRIGVRGSQRGLGLLSLRDLQATCTRCGNSGLELRKEEGLTSFVGHPHLQDN